MRRSLWTLCAFGLLCGVLCSGAYWLTHRWSAGQQARATDDLDWLRLEFRLGEPELARIRRLHQGYVPTCEDFCRQIEAAKRGLRGMLATATNEPPALEPHLLEIGRLRAQCQSAMLRHFFEVSREMPPDQGRRYLAEMQRLTLGAHEQFEQRMSGDASSPHAHH